MGRRNLFLSPPKDGGNATHVGEMHESRFLFFVSRLPSSAYIKATFLVSVCSSPLRASSHCSTAVGTSFCRSQIEEHVSMSKVRNSSSPMLSFHLSSLLMHCSACLLLIKLSYLCPFGFPIWIGCVDEDGGRMALPIATSM